MAKTPQACYARIMISAYGSRSIFRDGHSGHRGSETLLDGAGEAAQWIAVIAAVLPPAAF
jgi:hypothetical protein